MNAVELLAQVASELIAHRVRDGLELETLAALTGIEAERLAGAESASLALNDVELERLAEQYGIPVTAFFGGRTTQLSLLAGA